MKLIFFDEAKNDGDYPHYHIGAVCIDEEHLAPIEKSINAIAAATFGTSELSAATELHAAEIYHRKKNFKDWHDFDKRIDIIVQFALPSARGCVHVDTAVQEPQSKVRERPS